MEHFRIYLEQEYLKRVNKNPKYSLRAFANHLQINHASLSSILNGKRKITNASIKKLSVPLGLSPKQIQYFINTDTAKTSNLKNEEYPILQEEVFNLMSEWYFDAILELSLIKNVQLNPANISKILGINKAQAKYALDILCKFELLQLDQNAQGKIKYTNSTNIIDENTTTIAQKKYQESVMQKSLESLQSVDRKFRDHTSMTMAVSSKDIQAAKKLIKKFRQDLNAFMQREPNNFDEVYSLQVSFFPLFNKYTNNK